MFIIHFCGAVDNIPHIYSDIIQRINESLIYNYEKEKRWSYSSFSKENSMLLYPYQINREIFFSIKQGQFLRDLIEKLLEGNTLNHKIIDKFLSNIEKNFVKLNKKTKEGFFIGSMMINTPHGTFQIVCDKSAEIRIPSSILKECINPSDLIPSESINDFSIKMRSYTL